MCEDYQHKLRCSLALIETPQESPSAQTPLRTLLKSSVAPLPRCSSAENGDLTKILNQSEAVINKYKFSDYEKVILLTQVSGTALVLLNSPEAQYLGYIKAKELLEKIFASRKVDYRCLII